MARKKNPQETRQKIIETSLSLFREKGYEQTTILDIVDGLEGMTRGAFYHHFKTKEEVLFEIFEQLFDPTFFIELEKRTDLTGLEKLQRSFTHHIKSEFDLKDKELSMAYFLTLKNPRILAEHIDMTRGQMVEWTLPYVELGIEDGSIRAQDPRILTEFILIMANFWLLPALYPGGFEYGSKKVQMMKEQLASLGCPLIDLEMEEAIHRHVLCFMEEN